MDTTHIRPAVASDASGICRVHQRAVRVLCRADYTPAQIEAWIGPRRAEDYIAAMNSGENLWVAEISGAVVGFAGLKDDEVTAVYVDPVHARHGLGQALLEAVEQSARTHGVQGLVVEASLNAVPFYRRAGYGAEEPRTHRLRSGIAIPCVRMTKRLV
jgi:putative acetyltransferase